MPRKDSNQRKIIDEIVEYLKLREAFDKVKNEYEPKIKVLDLSINNYMYANGMDFIKIKDKSPRQDAGRNVIKVRKIKPTKIVWDAEKLEKKLDYDVAKMVIEKKYVIDDIDGLISYLKSCGVKPNIFKSFIRVERTINSSEFDRLDKLGVITKEDIEGCYNIVKNKSYIKVSRDVEYIETDEGE